MSATKPFLNVAVGVLINAAGEVLLAQRPRDKSWPDWWEFPGGKIETGETALAALGRELKEELGIQITTASPWVCYDYEYPKTRVRLAFFLVTAWDGEPKGIEGQQGVRWFKAEDAATLDKLLPASIAPLRWLSELSALYAISPAWHPESDPEELNQYVAQAIQRGVRLFQFRQPQWPTGTACPKLKRLFEHMLALCHAQGAKLLINSVHPKAWWAAADGVQLRAADAILLEERPLAESKLLGVSCHHLGDILNARRLAADFMLLGHVLPSSSHPNEAAMGWHKFAELAAQASRPVYAIGGLRPTDLEVAQAHHAHGIAAISAFKLSQ